MPPNDGSCCSLSCITMDTFTAGAASNASTSRQWDDRQSRPAGAGETPSLDSRFVAPGSKGASIRAFRFGNIWCLGRLILKASFCVSAQSRGGQFPPNRT